MRSSNILRNLRSFLWLAVAALIPICLASLYRANQAGLPDSWRLAIENELANHGAFVEIASLTYLPLRGFTAEGIRIFAEEEKTTEISSLERVQMVLDNARLAKGEFRLRSVDLDNVQLALPIDQKEPTGETLKFKNINGSITLSGERTIELEDTTAIVGGIQLTLNGILLTKDKKHGGEDDEKDDGRRRELVAKLIEQIETWQIDPSNPPKVTVNLSGDFSDKRSLKATYYGVASNVQKKGAKLKNLEVSGSLSGQLFTIDRIYAKDSRGELTGNISYDVGLRKGQCSINSSLNLPRLMKAWAEIPLDKEVLLGGSQDFQINASISLPEDAPMVLNATGNGALESVIFKGITLQEIETDFSYQNGDLFLRDMQISTANGKANADFRLKDGEVKIALESTFPPALYKPLFTGKPLEKILGHFSSNSGATTHLTLNGSFLTSDTKSWSYNGAAKISNQSFQNVPLKSVDCSFSVNTKELIFESPKITFDYSSYPLRKTFGGARTGTATAKKVRFHGPERLVHLTDVRGKIYPAPLLALFAPEMAKNLERYRFHNPPSLSSSGVVDITPKGRTDLRTKLTTNSPANFEFLGKELTLKNPSASVHIRGKQVRVDNLVAKVFQGELGGKIRRDSNATLRGEFTITKLSWPAIAKRYDFNVQGGGRLTGRIDFNLPAGGVSKLSGNGLVGLEKAELFSVPVFGPLSSVMAKVLDDDRAGFERAKYAFCNFFIKNGIISTYDFQTATSSINFAGNGIINLPKQTIDFTVRLNARGLLGILTLPLRPFTGLFQFHGTGPIKKPIWESVRYTSPSKLQNEFLLKPPPKAKIVRE